MIRGVLFRKYVMVSKVINTLFINIWNVGDREPPALDVMVWKVLNLRLRMRNPFRDRLNMFCTYILSVLTIAQLGEHQTVVLKVVSFEPTWWI